VKIIHKVVSFYNFKIEIDLKGSTGCKYVRAGSHYSGKNFN